MLLPYMLAVTGVDSFTRVINVHMIRKLEADSHINPSLGLKLKSKHLSELVVKHYQSHMYAHTYLLLS